MVSNPLKTLLFSKADASHFDIESVKMENKTRFEPEKDREIILTREG